MSRFTITHDPIEIITGESSKASPLYLEAANEIDTNSPKGLGYVKNFLTSIESVASKVSDQRISGSRGNLKQFSGYGAIKASVDFLSKNLSGLGMVKDLSDIFDYLQKYEVEYIEGYTKHVRLIILEYESAVYLLTTGLAFVNSNYLDIQQSGSSIKIVKKQGEGKGLIVKTVKDLATQLKKKEHQDYLKDLLKSTEKGSVVKEESVILTEAVHRGVGVTLELLSTLWNGIGKIAGFAHRSFKTLKATLFGIIPLIRTIIYLRYKKKADSILALEEQMNFISRNIEQLQNMKGMDEKKKADIIQKQKAVIEAYRKRSEKLRAQLIENENDTAKDLKDSEPDIKKGGSSNDDLVLESYLESLLKGEVKKDE